MFMVFRREEMLIVQIQLLDAFCTFYFSNFGIHDARISYFDTIHHRSINTDTIIMVAPKKQQSTRATAHSPKVTLLSDLIMRPMEMKQNSSKKRNVYSLLSCCNECPHCKAAPIRVVNNNEDGNVNHNINPRNTMVMRAALIGANAPRVPLFRCYVSSSS